jgi:hypothetical protein
MDDEKEMARLDRAIKRQGLKELKDSGFSRSEAVAIQKASASFIEDHEDDVEEEEIIVEDLSSLSATPTPEPEGRGAELAREAERVKREGEEAARRAREAEQQARREREAAEARRQAEEEERKRQEAAAVETEEQRLARLLAETTKRREQEQLALQAKLRDEKTQLQREREFADKALQVATQAAAAPRKEPQRQVRICCFELALVDLGNCSV